MSESIVVIDHRRVELHDAFLRFVPRVFSRASFRRWYELGGWDPDYRAFAIFAGDQIVANVSLQRMNLVMQGEPCTGLQLGAVGVVPERRGRGLQRQLMDFVLQQASADELLFLFANEDVVDFYPKFGFRPAQEWIFSLELALTPQTGALRRLSVDCAADRALLATTAATALPATRIFGAARYGSVALWHWTNDGGYEAYYHETDRAIVFVEHDIDVLRICDVLAAGDIDLEAYFPHLIEAPIEYVEFGFTPERLFPAAQAEFEYLESPLFVRGRRSLSNRPFKFPMLAHT